MTTLFLAGLLAVSGFVGQDGPDGTVDAAMSAGPVSYLGFVNFDGDGSYFEQHGRLNVFGPLDVTAMLDPDNAYGGLRVSTDQDWAFYSANLHIGTRPQFEQVYRLSHGRLFLFGWVDWFLDDGELHTEHMAGVEVLPGLYAVGEGRYHVGAWSFVGGAMTVQAW